MNRKVFFKEMIQQRIGDEKYQMKDEDVGRMARLALYLNNINNNLFVFRIRNTSCLWKFYKFFSTF